jgi:hypothetical protein
MAGTEETGNVSLQAKGRDMFRLDADMGSGKRTWAVAHGTGKTLDPRITEPTKMPFANSLKMSNYVLPLLPLILGINDNTVSIQYKGTEDVAGLSAHHVRVTLFAKFQAKALGEDNDWIDYFIDLNSFNVVKVSFFVLGQKSMIKKYPFELSYSGYQTQNGVNVPFVITEMVGGQLVSKIQLTSINFNQGIDESVFKMQ